MKEAILAHHWLECVAGPPVSSGVLSYFSSSFLSAQEMNHWGPFKNYGLGKKPAHQQGLLLHLGEHLYLLTFLWPLKNRCNTAAWGELCHLCLLPAFQQCCKEDMEQLGLNVALLFWTFFKKRIVLF